MFILNKYVNININNNLFNIKYRVHFYYIPTQVKFFYVCFVLNYSCSSEIKMIGV